MESSSRVLKSQYNLIFSLLNNFVVTVLGFVTRTVFVHSLGSSYLGLNGLFTNVLTLLSLAELGIGSAITFSLYKPIADKDNEKIKSLMQLYKRSYQTIGWVILLVGLLLIPVLPYIVNLDATVDINYYIIYIMFLFNSVVSYWFFAYRSVIIYANQDGYITTRIETLFALIRSVIQFAILIIFRNYYLFLAIPILVGIIKNIIISIIAGRRYPIINEKNVVPLTKDERSHIFKNVYALSLFKISSVVYGATDNIIISAYLGTSIVGLLSNYTMIIQLVSTYVNMIFQSMYASVGNLNATESESYKYSIFGKLNFLNFWIYTYCTVCLGCFLNPCIKVWLGPEFCLQNSTVVLLSIVFLLPGLNNVINIYKDACGLFREVQYRALATAAINLITSIVLVKLIGLNGVFWGTIAAYITTIYVVDPRVVFNNVFNQKPIKYYIELLKYISIFLMIYLPTYIIVKQVSINSWISLILYFVVITIIVNAFLWLLFRRNENYKYLKLLVEQMIKKILKLIGKR